MKNATKNIADYAGNTPATSVFESTNAIPGPVASPCISVCVMDASSGYCTGCLRTIDEIAAWGQADEAFKSQVLQRIAERKLA
jgi:uncharacterized protein